jgi:hypothetical protein
MLRSAATTRSTRRAPDGKGPSGARPRELAAHKADGRGRASGARGGRKTGRRRWNRPPLPARHTTSSACADATRPTQTSPSSSLPGSGSASPPTGASSTSRRGRRCPAKERSAASSIIQTRRGVGYRMRPPTDHGRTLRSTAGDPCSGSSCLGRPLKSFDEHANARPFGLDVVACDRRGRRPAFCGPPCRRAGCRRGQAPRRSVRLWRDAWERSSSAGHDPDQLKSCSAERPCREWRRRPRASPRPLVAVARTRSRSALSAGRRATSRPSREPTHQVRQSSSTSRTSGTRRAGALARRSPPRRRAPDQAPSADRGQSGVHGRVVVQHGHADHGLPPRPGAGGRRRRVRRGSAAPFSGVQGPHNRRCLRRPVSAGHPRRRCQSAVRSIRGVARRAASLNMSPRGSRPWCPRPRSGDSTGEATWGARVDGESDQRAEGDPADDSHARARLAEQGPAANEACHAARVGRPPIRVRYGRRCRGGSRSG